MIRWVTASLAATAMVLAAAPPAAAEGDSADALFREGRRLMKKGRHAEACDAFARSNRAEPSVGALLNLGVCREKTGERARAWQAFRDAETLAAAESDRKRRRYAGDRAAALADQIAFVVLRVPEELHDVEDLVITLDGEPIEVEGEPLPVDPGSHTFAAELGEARWSRELEASAGGEPIAVAVEFEIGSRATPEPSGGLEDRPDPGRARRWLGLGLAGAGIAAAAAGTGFGLSARSLWNQVEGCREMPPCSADEIATGEKASSRANISTVLFVAAVGLAGAGTYLWLTAPRSGERGIAVAPLLDGSLAGAAISGRF
jgi:hypothetical protein